MAVGFAGCCTTNYEFDAPAPKIEFETVSYRPVYEVMHDKGAVRGKAESSYWFWGLFKTIPSATVIEIGGEPVAAPGLREAALFDAQEKSGATIILSPHVSASERKGFLGFCGTTTVVVEGLPAKLVDVK